MRGILLLLVAPAVVGLAGCTSGDRAVADAGTPAAGTPPPSATRPSTPGDFRPAPFMPAPGHPELPGTPPSSEQPVEPPG